MSNQRSRLEPDANALHMVSASPAEATIRSETGHPMLNTAPIFVNAFARGGSMILVNLLLSHPNVCCPSGETHKVFRGGVRAEPQWILFRGLSGESLRSGRLATEAAPACCTETR
jgi:hypothetical protein